MHDATFEAADPASAEAQLALRRYLAEIAERISSGVVGPADADAVDDFLAPNSVFLLVRAGGAVVGCGAVRALAPRVAEIKRMWIAADARGLGLGGQLLDALETAARELGYERVRLDTNEVLVEAIALYEAHSYQRIDRYNDHPDPTHFYEKALEVPGCNAPPA